MRLFQGSGVALITPFTKDGVDFPALGKLIDRQIAGHTDAIICCGTTGEPSTMTEAERAEVIRFTIERVGGRIPVIVSSGGNNTEVVIRHSMEAQKAGADGLLVVTPYYNKCTQNGLIAHYTAVADAVDIPIIVYNVPGRTGVNVQPQTLLQMSKHPNIRAIKEASGNIAQFTEMQRLCGDTVAIYSGEDGLILPIMALGGQGVISVLANVVPEQTHALTQAMLQGDLKTARELQFQYNPLVDRLFCEVNPIPVKAACHALGLCENIVRLPLTPMEEANRQTLLQAMRACGLSV